MGQVRESSSFAPFEPRSSLDLPFWRRTLRSGSSWPTEGFSNRLPCTFGFGQFPLEGCKRCSLEQLLKFLADGYPPAVKGTRVRRRTVTDSEGASIYVARTIGGADKGPQCDGLGGFPEFDASSGPSKRPDKTGLRQTLDYFREVWPRKLGGPGDFVNRGQFARGAAR